MACTDTKKQERAQRIEHAWKSMSKALIKEIDRRTRIIAWSYNFDLDFAVEEAVFNATEEFNRLFAEGYTGEEIEAVFKHYNAYRFRHDVYRELWHVWKVNEIAELAQKRIGSIPVQKGEQRETTIDND